MKSEARKRKLIAAGLALGAVLCAMACHSRARPEGETRHETNAGAPPAVAPQPFQVAAALLQKESKFDHARREHKSVACSQCHRRDERDPANPIPGRPYHDACVNCHARENFLEASSKSPLCAVCHGAGTTLDALEKVALRDFPKTLGAFGLKGFSHRTHLDSSKAPSGKAPSCGDCHRFDNRMSVASFPQHQECYGCHTHQAGQKLGDCGVCHVEAKSALRFERGLGATTFQYNFKHSSHLNLAGVKSNCAVCHKTNERPATPQSLDARPDIVRGVVSRGQRHQSACWNCHEQSREPVCAKCHLNGFPSR
jgi:hypothetical protein